MSAENKPAVYGVTVKDPAINRGILNFAAIMGVKPTPAVLMIVERYLALSPKEREKVEKRLKWMRHRNRGFRTLAHFVKDCPKPQAKAHVLPSLPASTQPHPIKEDTQTGLDL